MPEISESRYLTTAGWNDVPHLPPDVQRKMLKATPPWLRAARSKGTPSLGVGAIYPMDPDEISVSPFPIPDHWPRSYALDVGWKRTACLWSAWDVTIGVRYVYAEYYQGKQLPLVHAQAIKARGSWIKGVIDPAARGRSQRDGQQLMEEYKDLGLKLALANNSVEAGLHATWLALATGQTRIFSNLSAFWAEFREYHRDEDGKIVKKNDHLMDDLRYGEMSGKGVARVRPIEVDTSRVRSVSDRIAGY